MKDKIKNNLGFKVLAVIFAIFLWWTVVNIDDPIDSKQYNVPVTLLNTEYITNQGQSYHIVDDVTEVTVTVKARRKVLSKIKASNIVANADFQEMQNGTVPVRTSLSGFECKEITSYPRNLQIKTEATLKKTFPITTVAKGIPRDGYIVGKMLPSPQTVDISGPESSVTKISKVVARVDVSEMSTDKTVETELMYYDAADNLLDKSLFSSNCDINGVTVFVDMWRTKKVNVLFDTSQIQTEKGYVFTGIEVEPQTIRVAGTSEALNQLTQLQLGAEVLNMTGVKEKQEVIVDITEHLPEGIVLANNDEKNVVVRILIEKAGTKSLLLPVGSIKIENASEQFTIKKGAEQEIELQFSGTAEALETISNENIVAYIDLEKCTEAGTYVLDVKIQKLPDNCTYIGTATVEIVLEKK